MFQSAPQRIGILIAAAIGKIIFWPRNINGVVFFQFTGNGATSSAIEGDQLCAEWPKWALVRFSWKASSCAARPLWLSSTMNGAFLIASFMIFCNRGCARDNLSAEPLSKPAITSVAVLSGRRVVSTSL